MSKINICLKCLVIPTVSILATSSCITEHFCYSLVFYTIVFNKNKQILTHISIFLSVRRVRVSLLLHTYQNVLPNF